MTTTLAPGSNDRDTDACSTKWSNAPGSPTSSGSRTSGTSTSTSWKTRPPADGGPLRKVVVHEAEEGGYWAEVPAIPGCATQGETFEEMLANLYEAVEGCLSVDVRAPSDEDEGKVRVVEIAV